MKRIKMNRRTVLRGLGLSGLSIALPPLEAMMNDRELFHAVGRAQEVAPPKRLVVTMFPTGIYHNGYGRGGFFFPDNVGTNWNLTECLSGVPSYNIPGFDDLRNDINILGGLTNEYVNLPVGGNVHFNGQNILTGLPYVASRNSDGTYNYCVTAAGPSFDQVAAQQIGGMTKYRNLVVRLYSDRDTNAIWSWEGVSKPATAYSNPQTLMDEIFQVTDSGELEQVKRRKQSMLDFVKGDIDRWNKMLGVRDRATLDSHLTSIREIERSLNFGSMTCDSPSLTVGTDIMQDAQADVRSQMLVELIALALKCDLTRVAFYCVGGEAQHTHAAPFIGINLENHLTTHLEAGVDAAKRLSQWKVAQFGRLVRALKNATEGSGTVLSNCAAVCTSDMENSHGHWFANLPVIVAGNAGGMQTGRFVWYSCNGANIEGRATTKVSCGADLNGHQNVPISNLWLTMLKAVGVNQNSFGESSGTLSGLWPSAV